jgi:hypothetical protein
LQDEKQNELRISKLTPISIISEMLAKTNQFVICRIKDKFMIDVEISISIVHEQMVNFHASKCNRDCHQNELDQSEVQNEEHDQS